MGRLSHMKGMLEVYREMCPGYTEHQGYKENAQETIDKVY